MSTGYGAYPNKWAGTLDRTNIVSGITVTTIGQRAFDDDKRFFALVDEIKAIIDDPSASNKEDLRKLLRDLWYLHQPLVQETTELAVQVNWNCTGECGASKLRGSHPRDRIQKSI